MRVGARIGLLILNCGWAGAAMLAAGDGYVEDSTAPAGRSSTESSAASAATPELTALGDGLLLRASSQLGKSPPGRARRGAFESGETSPARSAAAAKLPGLRLQSSPSWQVRSVAVPAKPALTAGELNLDGLVRASRMQLRDGTIFLEGGRSADMPAPTSVDPDNQNSRLDRK